MDLRSMFGNMGGVAWGVVIALAIMSVYSIAVAIERFYTFAQATKQSRKYAPDVARFLKQGKIKEAIDASRGPAVQRATAVNLADLKRGLSGLATIGSTAPFVGLFGTTFGIINAFHGMSVTGSGGIAAISAGIAEALITTAFGLFVAVPAVWAYNYLT